MVEYRYTGRAGDPSYSGATVVIDVMRAFTTAAWAFYRGASRIVLVAHLQDALALRRDTPGALAFCDGEPKPGFDLFNSPAHLLELEVRGRTIVQRTTAGTQGAVASRHASPLLCTGFVTARATARYLSSLDVAAVCFVVTGGDEDRACAEHIHALLEGEDPGLKFIERARRSDAAASLYAGVEKGFLGVDQRDVEMCLELDRFDFAMVAVPSGEHIALTACDATGVRRHPKESAR